VRALLARRALVVFLAVLPLSCADGGGVETPPERDTACQGIVCEDNKVCKVIDETVRCVAP